LSDLGINSLPVVVLINGFASDGSIWINRVNRNEEKIRTRFGLDDIAIVFTFSYPSTESLESSGSLLKQSLENIQSSS